MFPDSGYARGHQSVTRYRPGVSGDEFPHGERISTNPVRKANLEADGLVRRLGLVGPLS